MFPGRPAENSWYSIKVMFSLKKPVLELKEACPRLEYPTMLVRFDRVVGGISLVYALYMPRVSLVWLLVVTPLYCDRESLSKLEDWLM